MSTTRGRVIRPGGVAYDPQGATPRTEAGPGNQPITRPAYRVSQGVFQPAGIGGPGGGAPLLDISGVPFWRLFWTLAAAAYLGFWFVSVRRGGVSAGVRL